MTGLRYQVRRYSAERGEMEIVRDVEQTRAESIVERDAAAGTVSTMSVEVRASGRMVAR